MTSTVSTLTRLRRPDDAVAARFTESATALTGAYMSTDEFRQWWGHRAAQGTFDVQRIPFDQLRDWYFEPSTGNLVHASGRFFSVEGLQTYRDDKQHERVTQPIIVQPEIGILGILVKEIGGVLHCLMQAKMEPGNVNTLQLSPTVQATRSNYTRVHSGGHVPYLEYFLDPRRAQVRADVLQSEQAEWFLRKRNRNIVVEVTGPVPEHEDFCWLTLGQLRELLREDNLVNMDSRTVLSAIPYQPDPDRAGFAGAAARSAHSSGPALHPLGEVLIWFNDAKVRHRVAGRRIPLVDLNGWRRTADEIVSDGPGHFRVVAASVRAGNREVGSWTQPLIAPEGIGLSAFLVKRIDGVLHVLVGVDVSAGYLDNVELAPTVQFPVANSEHRPDFLGLVEQAPAAAVRYDTVLSEEGGRFYHAQTRYRIVEVGDEVPDDVSPDQLWVTIGQLTDLVRRGFHVNVQARTLLGALHGLW